MKKKTAKIGITGSARYMRELVKNGTSKADAFNKMLAKWPHFVNDKAGLASRWEAANRLVKSEARRDKDITKAARKVVARAAAPPPRRTPQAG
jgi:hypothetical protein